MHPNRHPLTGVYAIYAIINLINGHRYIGSTDCVASRWRRHRFDLKHGVHHSIYLQRAYQKYGSEAFSFVLMERTERTHEALITREQYWFDQLKPVYNMSKEAARNVPSPEAALRRGDRLAKDYIVTRPDGTEIEVHNLTAFCRDNGLEYAQLGQVVRGRQGHHQGWKARRKVDPKPPYQYYQYLHHVFEKDGIRHDITGAALNGWGATQGVCSKSLRRLMRGEKSEISGYRYIRSYRA